MMLMKRSMSCDNGVGFDSRPDAKIAILPIDVLSPTRITIPRPLPVVVAKVVKIILFLSLLATFNTIGGKKSNIFCLQWVVVSAVGYTTLRFTLTS